MASWMHTESSDTGARGNCTLFGMFNQFKYHWFLKGRFLTLAFLKPHLICLIVGTRFYKFPYLYKSVIYDLFSNWPLLGAIKERLRRLQTSPCTMPMIQFADAQSPAGGGCYSVSVWGMPWALDVFSNLTCWQSFYPDMLAILLT